MIRTIPGNKPPSAIPSSARTATKEPKPLMKPRHMVMIPHKIVKNGSHILGEAFFRTRLLGNSLIIKGQPYLALSEGPASLIARSPANIKQIENC